MSVITSSMFSSLIRPHFVNLALLSLVCGVLFFLFLGRTPFHNKGEPREALVVQDIVDNGNWLFPLKLGRDIPSKPPLFHWMGAISSILWGEMTETTIRFPSALLATLGVLLVYYLGAKLYGQETGLFAGLMLATTVVYQNAAVEARVDMTLVFFLTLPLVLFFGIYQGFFSKERWWYLFFLISGAGVLAKGPVSLILSGIIIGVFLAIRKRWWLFARLVRHPGVILCVAIFGAWYGVALWTGGSDFAVLQFVKENLARFFVHGEGGTGHQKPLYYFVPYLLPLGFPWTMFLPLLLWSYFRDKWFTDDRSLFLGIWVAVILLFFSLSAGKRPPYILPIYPPLVSLIAVWCHRFTKEPVAGSKALPYIGWLAGAIGAATFLLLASHAMWNDTDWPLHSSALGLEPETIAELEAVQQVLDNSGWFAAAYVAAAGVLWVVIGRTLLRQKIATAVIQMAAFAALTFVVIQGLIAPARAEARSYKEFVRAATEKIADGEVVLLFPRGVDSSSIVFYGGAKIERLTGNMQTLRQALEQSDNYVILGERQWRRIGAEIAALPLFQSRGAGPDGDDPLVLVRGLKSNNKQ
jgi:4-amino-4-deoxy-L-arabinose transferase-like glycosyltransferase